MRKKFLLLCSFLGLLHCVNAAVITVQVTNFQFSPANIPNAVVGDIIRFQFVQGFHNATSANVANAIPAGAAPVNSGQPASNEREYDYTIEQVGTYKYICEVHANAANFTGMVGTFTAMGALPVSLKYFRLITSTDKKPTFNWETLAEENVSHFAIRYSYDGFKYSEASRIAAAGNSTVPQTYNYKHTGISTKYKYVYYMLAMVDKDGKEKLSNIVLYKNTTPGLPLITQIGPNPIKRPGQLMLQFNAEKKGSMVARVTNADGKFIMKVNMSASPGLNNAHLHVCDLPAGIYNIQFFLEGVKETKRIVVQ